MPKVDVHAVTAVLVTRGDVDIAPILDSLIFDRVIVWDNSVNPDWKCAGRYMGALQCETQWCYWQDDDTIVSPEVQEALLDEAYEYEIVANWGHGTDPAGYDDLPLLCGGAVANWRSSWDCIARYAAHWPLDLDFMYEADFVVGALYKNWKHIHLPFEIRDVAYNGKRLADESWQRDLKYEMTQRARAIRDAQLVTA